LGFTIGAGWGMLFYAEWFPEWFRVLLALGWTAGLLVPTGFLMRRRWESVAAGIVVVVAVAVVPTVLGLSPTRAIEWAGVATGLAAGVLTARVAAHGSFQPRL
jgi:predicted amidohydrolase